MKGVSMFLFLATTAFALLCGGCATSNLDPAEQAKLDRINSTLPFNVTVDGVKAAKATPICAKLARPVPNNAELIVDAPKGDVIVVSFFPCDQDGIVVSGGKPALIIIRGDAKTTLDDTLDQKPLKAGFHLMRITAGGKTASVLLDLVESKAPKKKPAK